MRGLVEAGGLVCIARWVVEIYPISVHMFIPSALGSGSCGLEYRLVEVPKTLRDDYTDTPSSWASFFGRRFLMSSVTR